MTSGQRIEHVVTYLLGAVVVELDTDEPAVVDYLAEFYPTTTMAVPPDWVVDARLGRAGGMRRNSHGVAYAADPAARELVVRADDATDLAITTRKMVREALVEFCERHRYAMVHASAVADGDRVIVVVGDKGSGKTTLALRAVLEHGARYVSNDHLIVYPGDAAATDLTDRLVVTSLPTPIPVKVGTYLDLEHLLPEPWDAENLDVDAYRFVAATERHRHDQRVLYTYRRLGQDNPVTLSLDSPEAGPRVTVVLARYADAGEGPSGPVPVADPVASLLRHVRFDWPFDPVLNQHHLPRCERDRAAYADDARQLVEALTSRAEVLAWPHHGDPAPLLPLTGGRL